MTKTVKHAASASTSSIIESELKSSATIYPAKTLTDGLPLPKLVVFDLDYTLWPFWVDTHVTPPLKPVPNPSGPTIAVKDRTSERFTFYSDVPSILYTLQEKGIQVGAASRTSAPKLANEMLNLLHIPVPEWVSKRGSKVEEDGEEAGEEAVPKARKAITLFDHLEIYPGDKKTHFQRLKKSSGVGFEDMLFFDDEVRNRNVEALGVTMWLVRDGVSWGELDNGVQEWRKRRLSGK